MADDSVKDEVKTDEPAPKPEVTASELETTVAGDGDLPINNGGAEAATKPADIAAPVADAAPMPTVPETPIVVTDSEVSRAQPETSLNSVPAPTTPPPAGDGLSDQVESLSGEIQALEAKIDRLTGNVKPVAEAAKATEPTPTPVKVAAEPPVKPPVDLSAPPVPMTPSKAETKTVSVNDIYTKSAKTETAPPPSASGSSMPQGADVAEEVGSGSTVGSIGEVLSAIGVIFFIAMVAFPFYKSFLTADLSDTVRTIGWPTSVVTLLLGFLLGLFSKGKVFSKILVALLVILAAIVYLGVSGHQSWLGPLGSLLDSSLSFYR